MSNNWTIIKVHILERPLKLKWSTIVPKRSNVFHELYSISQTLQLKEDVFYQDAMCSISLIPFLKTISSKKKFVTRTPCVPSVWFHFSNPSAQRRSLLPGRHVFHQFDSISQTHQLREEVCYQDAMCSISLIPFLKPISSEKKFVTRTTCVPSVWFHFSNPSAQRRSLLPGRHVFHQFDSISQTHQLREEVCYQDAMCSISLIPFLKPISSEKKFVTRTPCVPSVWFHFSNPSAQRRSLLPGRHVFHQFDSISQTQSLKEEVWYQNMMCSMSLIPFLKPNSSKKKLDTRTWCVPWVWFHFSKPSAQRRSLLPGRHVFHQFDSISQTQKLKEEVPYQDAMCSISLIPFLQPSRSKKRHVWLFHHHYYYILSWFYNYLTIGSP